MCVLFLSGVVPIAFTVLLGKMYLLLVLCTVLYQLCCVCISLLLSLLAATESHLPSQHTHILPSSHPKLMVSSFTAYILHLLASWVWMQEAQNHEGNSGNLFKYVLGELSLLVTQGDVKISWGFCIPIWTQDPRKNKWIAAKFRNFMIPEAIYYPQFLLWLKGTATSFGSVTGPETESKFATLARLTQRVKAHAGRHAVRWICLAC